MKILLRFAAFLFCLFVSLPMLHKAIGFPPRKRLFGVEYKAEKPERTWNAWWNGKMQSAVETRLNQRIGFRGAMVHTANQINFSLFGIVPRGRGTRITKGLDGFFYESVYVDTYGKSGRSADDVLREYSNNVRRLQDFLEADGIAFVLVIAPSKAEIYPEHLPAGVDVAGRPNRRSNYDNIVVHLRREGVHLLDGHHLFREWRNDPETPLLFAKGGTHWNHYGATRIVESLCGMIREQTQKDFPAIRVVGATTDSVIAGADNDLVDTLNLWTRTRLAGPQTHPVVERIPGADMPNMLFVGDSFVLTLTGIMDSENLYAKRNTYYYFKRQLFFPIAPEEPIDRKQLDVLAKIRARDAVVIEICEYWLPKIGFSFMGEVLKAYEDEKEQGK